MGRCPLSEGHARGCLRARSLFRRLLRRPARCDPCHQELARLRRSRAGAPGRERAANALPRTGVEISSGDLRAGEPILGALRELQPAHLHLAVEDGEAPGIDAVPLAALLAAGSAGLRLDVSCADPSRMRATLQRLGGILVDAAVAPEGVAVLPSDPRSVAAAREAFPTAAIGGGTPHYFAQLNRLEGLGEVASRRRHWCMGRPTTR